jgi:hypothetical protein
MPTAGLNNSSSADAEMEGTIAGTAAGGTIDPVNQTKNSGSTAQKDSKGGNAGN